MSIQPQLLHAAFSNSYNNLFLHIFVLSQSLLPQSLIILTKIFLAAFAIHFNNAQVIKIRSMDLSYFILNERRGSVC